MFIYCTLYRNILNTISFIYCLCLYLVYKAKKKWNRGTFKWNTREKDFIFLVVLTVSAFGIRSYKCYKCWQCFEAFKHYS